MNYEETKIQISFIKWINIQYPKLSQFIIHIPNGGKMSEAKGRRLKSMGVKAGVADILFMWRKKDFGGLWLEFKTTKGKQSEVQKEFEKNCHSAQYDYQIVKSLNEAIKAINRYINLPD